MLVIEVILTVDGQVMHLVVTSADNGLLCGQWSYGWLVFICARFSHLGSLFSRRTQRQMLL